MARSKRLEELMEKYGVQSKGKTLSGHFAPRDAVDVLETVIKRNRSRSGIITAAALLGLATFKEQFPPVDPEMRGRQQQVHTVNDITPALAKRMEELSVPSKGMTLSGHFPPEEAVDILETAETRGMSVGRVITGTVRFGLPELKRDVPAARAA